MKFQEKFERFSSEEWKNVDPKPNWGGLLQPMQPLSFTK